MRRRMRRGAQRCRVHAFPAPCVLHGLACDVRRRAHGAPSTFLHAVHAHAQETIEDAAALALEGLHEPVVAAMQAAGASCNMPLASARVLVAKGPLHGAVCKRCAGRVPVLLQRGPRLINIASPLMHRALDCEPADACPPGHRLYSVAPPYDSPVRPVGCGGHVQSTRPACY